MDRISSPVTIHTAHCMFGLGWLFLVGFLQVAGWNERHKLNLRRFERRRHKGSRDTILWLKRPVCHAAPVNGYGREGERHTGGAIPYCTSTEAYTACESAGFVPRSAQREVYHPPSLKKIPVRVRYLAGTDLLVRP